VVSLEHVTKVFGSPRREVTALSDVSLQVAPGEFLVVRGPSGSGKTTLLLTIAGMLRPTRGDVTVHGQRVYAAGPRAQSRFRAAHVGFVFQSFHLVPYLTVLENILLAGGGVRRKDGPEHATRLLARVDLAERAVHRPSELSVGEKQRAAVARALFNDPKLLLADEPTGNLDPDNAAHVLTALTDYHRDGGTVVVVTHRPEAAEFAGRTLLLRAGHLTEPE